VNNLLIVTSNGWGYNLQQVRDTPLADGNTAYAWHVYAGTDHNDPAAWERNLAGLDEIRPVIVSEWDSAPIILKKPMPSIKKSSVFHLPTASCATNICITRHGAGTRYGRRACYNKTGKRRRFTGSS